MRHGCVTGIFFARVGSRRYANKCSSRRCMRAGGPREHTVSSGPSTFLWLRARARRRAGHRPDAIAGAVVSRQSSVVSRQSSVVSRQSSVVSRQSVRLSPARWVESRTSKVEPGRVPRAGELARCGPLTFDPRPSTLDLRPSTLDPRPSTLDLRPLTFHFDLRPLTSASRAALGSQRLGPQQRRESFVLSR